eukprot:scaffold2466_cov134-Pinguiococcus_pyrenoidosus.AAC.1
MHSSRSAPRRLCNTEFCGQVGGSAAQIAAILAWRLVCISGFSSLHLFSFHSSITRQAKWLRMSLLRSLKIENASSASVETISRGPLVTFHKNFPGLSHFFNSAQVSVALAIDL